MSTTLRMQYTTGKKRHLLITTEQHRATAGSIRHRAAPALALASVIVPLSLILWVTLGAARSPSAAQPGTRPHVYALTTRSLDPRLIVRPRTVTQVADAGGMRLTLAVHPVLPGPNHVVVALADRGQVLRGARVQVVAAMPDMVMTPVRLEAHEVRGGQYVGTAGLPMFGPWQLTVRVQQPDAAPLRHVFTVNIDLPAPLLQAVAAAREGAGS